MQIKLNFFSSKKQVTNWNEGSQQIGRSCGGGGNLVDSVGPFSTWKAVANPHGKCTSKWQCIIQTPENIKIITGSSITITEGKKEEGRKLGLL